MKANMIFYIAGTVSFYAAELLLTASIFTAGLTLVAMGLILLALGAVCQWQNGRAAVRHSGDAAVSMEAAAASF